jgi:hypothetical protein
MYFKLRNKWSPFKTYHFVYLNNFISIAIIESDATSISLCTKLLDLVQMYTPVHAPSKFLKNTRS